MLNVLRPMNKRLVFASVKAVQMKYKVAVLRADLVTLKRFN